MREAFKKRGVQLTWDMYFLDMEEGVLEGSLEDSWQRLPWPGM